VAANRYFEILSFAHSERTSTEIQLEEFGDSLDEEPRKLRKPEEEPAKFENGHGEELRKLSKPSGEEKNGRVRSSTTGLPLDAPRWRRVLEDKTIVVQRARNLPQTEAERAAFEIVLIEFLNATHSATDPNCCAWCGKPEGGSDILLPIGVGIHHAWLHSICVEPWRSRRREVAVAELATMKIEDSRGTASEASASPHQGRGPAVPDRHQRSGLRRSKA
jgi:hypothetical protein